MSEYTIYKDAIDHTFQVELLENGTILVDDRPVTHPRENELEFGTTRTIKGMVVGGIYIDDEIENEIETIRVSRATEVSDESNRRDADRPAPTLDLDGLVMYHYGCDTHTTYSRAATPRAIDNAVNAGATQVKVFTGARDATCQFPDMHDSRIPASYVKKNDDGYVADGYKNVWCEDTFVIPFELVDAEQKKIDRAKNEKALAKKNADDLIFATAKHTGKRQPLNKWSDVCDDPREECDIDNVVEYAMPDGSKKTERYHTW